MQLLPSLKPAGRAINVCATCPALELPQLWSYAFNVYQTDSIRRRSCTNGRPKCGAAIGPYCGWRWRAFVTWVLQYETIVHDNFDWNTLKCFYCVDLNVSQKVLLKEKGQSAETKSQPCTRQVLARIGAAAAVRTRPSMLSHYRMFIDSLQRQSTKCNSKCKMRCILPFVSLPFRHKWYGATVDARSLRSLCGETYQAGRRQEGVKKYWKNSSWVWRGGMLHQLHLIIFFDFNVMRSLCSSCRVKVDAWILFRHHHATSHQNRIKMHPTRFVMFWLCHCLFDFRILMRQGWLLNRHTTASERYGHTFAGYISHCIPIYSHIIPSYPFIQFSSHEYPWSKLHSFLSAGWGHHRRGSIAEARLCWGKALGTLKACESIL